MKCANPLYPETLALFADLALFDDSGRSERIGEGRPHEVRQCWSLAYFRREDAPDHGRETAAQKTEVARTVEQPEAWPTGTTRAPAEQPT